MQTRNEDVAATRISGDKPITIASRDELDSSGNLDPAAVKKALSIEAFDERYGSGEVIGRGGMGEVRLYLDRRIGRDVAQKTLRVEVAKSPISVERFVREARVQGQLEHPAVVPVYDLGVDPSGRIFFTMKRIRGTALDEVLDARARGDADVLARFSRRKLLSAFVQVCLAVDFAHSRGVLHRDLKPANIMLGDYGEVHVLDWGLAKVHGVREPERVGRDTLESVPMERESAPVRTLAGSVLGTPGYMSPEQARGDTDGLDGRTDVYSLGAILFEIVFREALHQGNGVMPLMTSTLSGASMDASSRTHGTDVPPELEALCKKACALEPELRPASARALAEGVERFLDGERDDERRKEIARSHVAEARALAAKADEGDETARTEALRALGRALVLDPTDEEALRALEALLTHVPDEPPPGAREAVARAEAGQRRATFRATAMRHAAWLVIGLVTVALSPIRDLPLATGVIAGFVALTAYSVLAWRASSHLERWWLGLVLGTATMIGLCSTVFGPFVLVPALASATSVLLAPQTTASHRRWLHGALVLALVVPALLSELDVVPRFYELQGDGTMLVRSPLLRLEGTGTLIGLLLANVAIVVLPGVLAGRFFDRLRALEARTIVQGWQLRQLLPRREPTMRVSTDR